jgi:hypothetical protein
VLPSFDDGAFDASVTSGAISSSHERPSRHVFASAPIGSRLRRIADSFLRNEQRYNVGYGQNEGSSITRVMPPPPSQESLWPLTCISNISRTSIMTEVHSSLPMRGDALVRISVDSGPHPQYIADFNYNGGTFELTHEGDALI